MYDATTGQTTTQMPIHSPPARFSVEAGYDAFGAFVYDQVALDPVGDPLVEIVDDVRAVRIRNGVVYLFDADGNPIVGTSVAPTLQDVLGAADSDPLVILDGLVLSQFPQPGTSAQRSTTTTTVTDVTQSGNLTTVSTLVQSSDPAVPDLPQRRVYAQQGAVHVLSEIQTDVTTQTAGVTMSGQATFRFENVTYHRNQQMDAARREGTVASAWGGGGAAAQDVAMPYDYYDPDCDGTGSGGSGGGTGGGGTTPTGCDVTMGGANLVYVHGIYSDGGAWGSVTQGTSPQGGVVGSIRCALQIGSDSRPSLTAGGDSGTGSHADQASQLLSHVQGLGQTENVFVGHSQGGLVSRRVAQGSWGQQLGNVRAVVTTGTPHLGAPIARTLDPGSVVQRYSNAFKMSMTCRAISCGAVSSAFDYFVNGYLRDPFASPAMADLRPNSAAIQAVNGPVEGFPRYGIVHQIPKRWAIARVAGDAINNEGPSRVNDAKTAYWVLSGTAVAGGILGILFPPIAPFTGYAAATAVSILFIMDTLDRWWNAVTVGSSGRGDGVVPESSQRYPRATFNYVVPEQDVVSHTAQIDTRVSSRSIDRILDLYVNVPRR